MNVSQIHDTSRHTLFSVLVVNSALNQAVFPFIYREWTLDFNNLHVRELNKGDPEPVAVTQEGIQRLLDMEATASIFRAIRKLVVRSSLVRWSADEPEYFRNPNDKPGPSDEQIISKWSPFSELVSRSTNLLDITFDCQEQMPLILIDALHPSTRLHVRNWTRLREDARVGDLREEALARSTCLRSLSAHFTTGGPVLGYNQPALRRIVSLAPNLESFECTTRSKGGCVSYTFSMAHMDVYSEEAAKFGVPDVPPKPLKSLCHDLMGIRQIQQWNLEELESLTCRAFNMEVLTYAMHNQLFKNLRHLSLCAPWYQEEVGTTLKDIITLCHPLESLSIVNFSRTSIPIAVICLHHGPFLRSLALHNVEDDRSPRPTIPLSELAHLCSATSQLESLEIDINRTPSGSDECQIYSLLSTFPNLSSITIHYDLGFKGSGDAYRIVGPEFGERVWRAIAKPLYDLRLYVGEPNREPPSGRPEHWISEEVRRRQRLHVRRHERDDMRDKLEIMLTGCIKLDNGPYKYVSPSGRFSTHAALVTS